MKTRYWVISEEALSGALEAVHDGGEPTIVLLELLANSAGCEVD